MAKPQYLVTHEEECNRRYAAIQEGLAEVRGDNKRLLYTLLGFAFTLITIVIALDFN